MDRAGLRVGRGGLLPAGQPPAAAAPGAQRRTARRHPARVRHDPGQPAAVAAGAGLRGLRGRAADRGPGLAGRRGGIVGRSDRHDPVLPGHRHGPRPAAGPGRGGGDAGRGGGVRGAAGRAAAGRTLADRAHRARRAGGGGRDRRLRLDRGAPRRRQPRGGGAAHGQGSVMDAGVHIETTGQGPDLVLVHGWAMHAGVFSALAGRLAGRYTLHLVDLPGHGHGRNSTLPLALEPVVEAIVARVPRALWAGWSLGGLFALHAAATRPDAVRGLAMLCASPRFVRGEDWPLGMSPEIFRGFALGLRSDWRATLERFIALEAFGSDDARREMRVLRDEVFARGEPAAHVLADGLGLLETVDLRPALPGLRMPSLWLAGRRDRLVDPRAMCAAAALAPGADVVVVEHAGHAPFLTHADVVADALDRFAAAAAEGGA